MSEVIADTADRVCALINGVKPENVYEELCFAIANETRVDISCHDMSGRGTTVYMHIDDAEKWLKKCLDKIKDHRVSEVFKTCQEMEGI